MKRTKMTKSNIYDSTELDSILDKIDWSITTPSRELVVRSLSDLEKVKVVILGQDPYPTKGVANGIAFAVNEGIKIPQSLNNIFKEVQKVQGEVFADRTLNSWIEQGVLLLNTSLTTEIGNPGSHKKLWDEFSKKLISNLSKKPIIWVLWGNHAKSMKKYINNSALIIEDAHPSPLSVRHRKCHTFVELMKHTNIKW